jgi:hypothetical protein
VEGLEIEEKREGRDCCLLLSVPTGFLMPFMAEEVFISTLPPGLYD